MREKKFNVTRDVYIPKVDSKWLSKTKKKKPFFLSFTCLMLNSKGTLSNETPISISSLRLGRFHI